MPIVNATTARQNFFELMNTTIEAHDPVYVTGKQGNMVMVSEEDYRAMQETIYLSSIPAVKEKIVRGLATPLSECVEDDDDIALAKRLGLNPRSLIKNIPNKSELWKAPIKNWLREIEAKRKK